VEKTKKKEKILGPATGGCAGSVHHHHRLSSRPLAPLFVLLFLLILGGGLAEGLAGLLGRWMGCDNGSEEEMGPGCYSMLLYLQEIVIVVGSG
jgi:hypothetical protein